MPDRENEQLQKDFEQRNEDRKFRHRPELYTVEDAKRDKGLEELYTTNQVSETDKNKETLKILEDLKQEKERLAEYQEQSIKLEPEKIQTSEAKTDWSSDLLNRYSRNQNPVLEMIKQLSLSNPAPTIDQGYTENNKLENSEVYYPKVSKEEPVETEELFDDVYGETFKEDTAPDLMEQGAALYRQRNALYGNSYKKQGRILEVLFPNGVQLKTVKDFNRFTVFSTIISKILRYSNDFNTPHDDSVLDNMVYFAMLLELDRAKD